MSRSPGSPLSAPHTAGLGGRLASGPSAFPSSFQHGTTASQCHLSAQAVPSAWDALPGSPAWSSPPLKSPRSLLRVARWVTVSAVPKSLASLPMAPTPVPGSSAQDPGGDSLPDLPLCPQPWAGPSTQGPGHDQGSRVLAVDRNRGPEKEAGVGQQKESHPSQLGAWERGQTCPGRQLAF